MRTTVPKAEFDALKADFNQLKFQYDQLIKLLNGSKSERFVLADNAGVQAQLFEGDQAVLPQSTTADKPEKQPKKKVARRKPHPGRTPFPDHLPVREVILEPEGVNTEDLVYIGDVVTRKVDFIPGKLEIVEYRRKKYIRREDQEQKEKAAFFIAPPPIVALWKSIAGVGLLTEIVVAKFVDHLPFHRQIERFLRDHAWKIHPATMNNWFAGICEVLQPLYAALQKDVLDTSYLQGDESRILVLERQNKQKKPTSEKEKKRRYQKRHLGYMWVFRNPISGNVFFVYRKGRGANVLNETLGEFTGLLQSDGYSAYSSYVKKHKNVNLVSCMAHIRRKFFEAQSNNRGLAVMVLSCIQYLYAVERYCRERNYTPERRLRMRQLRSKPVFEMLLDYVQFSRKINTRTGAYPQAVLYACNHLPRLKWMFEDGRV